jgi:enamine deaminase RidA (YjgF/YER057c/UK114 family)
MEYTENSFTAYGVRTFSPSGALSKLSEEMTLSQAIVIPPHASLVVTSGQCGFREDLSLPENVHEQILLAFENAEKSLKAAGVADGWKSVYQMTTYTPSIDDEWLAAMAEAKEKYLDKNRPAWTGVTVPNLYGGARLEMTLHAFIAPSK